VILRPVESQKLAGLLAPASSRALGRIDQKREPVRRAVHSDQDETPQFSPSVRRHFQYPSSDPHERAETGKVLVDKSQQPN